MNYKIIALAAGILLTLKTTAIADTLNITEQNETITVTLNGTTPVPFDLTGPPDGWTIELGGGYSFSPNLVGGDDIILGEPENATKINIISITQPTFMIWESDKSPLAPASVLPTSLTLAGGAMNAAGAPLDLVLTDVVGAPDSASTFALAGLGLAALAAFRPTRK